LRCALHQANGTTGPGESVVQTLQGFVKNRPLEPGAWLKGFGWDQNEWADTRFPTREQLDTAFPSTPIWLTRIDGHAAWANSAAIRAAPLLPSKDPEGGTIERDPATGLPTGVFTDNAMALIENSIPVPTRKETADALTLVLADAAAHGLTGVHNPGITPGQVPLFKSFIDAGKFTLRQYAMYLGVSGGLGRAATPSTPKVDPEYAGKLTVKAVKFFMDGALGSWGAAMIQNYTDRPDEHGQLRMTEAEYDRNVSAWAAAGFQIATHAIGDMANRVVLDKYRQICIDGGVPDLRYALNPWHAFHVRVSSFRTRSGTCVADAPGATSARFEGPWHVNKDAPYESGDRAHARLHSHHHDRSL